MDREEGVKKEATEEGREQLLVKENQKAFDAKRGRASLECEVWCVVVVGNVVTSSFFYCHSFIPHHTQNILQQRPILVEHLKPIPCIDDLLLSRKKRTYLSFNTHQL